MKENDKQPCLDVVKWGPDMYRILLDFLVVPQGLSSLVPSHGRQGRQRDECRIDAESHPLHGSDASVTWVEIMQEKEKEKRHLQRYLQSYLQRFR